MQGMSYCLSFYMVISDIFVLERDAKLQPSN